jgi:uncharacterized protein
MDPSLVLQNLLSPPVLFFGLGLLSVLLRSDLEIPAPLPKLFSLYLLLAIGLKGGIELQHSGLDRLVLLTIGAALTMAVLVPITSFLLLRTRFDTYNAAALAAAYGSISAVTFITAETFLGSLAIPFDGFMVAALALMESPAIIIGLLLVRLTAPRAQGPGLQWGSLLHEAFLNSSVLVLVGSLLIGALGAAYSPAGIIKMEPFTEQLFYGALSFFLLDMGIVAGQRLRELQATGAFLIGFALLSPPVHAAAGLGVSLLLHLPQGDALLFMVLCASASYIAVPAAMRMTVPQANPSLYITASLGLTFPFNIVVGIPLYMAAVQRFIPAV